MFNKTPAFEKCIIRKNKLSEDSFIEDLEELNEKSNERIKKVLENRVEAKEYFTKAGTNLVCIEGGSGKSILLKKFVENVYEKLKITHKTQVVALNGSSIRLKEGCKSNVLAHLGFLSNSCQGFVQAVHCAYELVSIFASDGSNLYFGECIEVMFDGEFGICGCCVKAKLTDLDFSENCGIFRILLSLAEPNLQHFGLMHRARVDKNIELHQQFKANLDLLGISWSETLDIMELLSVALLTEDLTFNTSNYTLAGQKAINKYLLSSSRHLTKISKILSIIPERLSDFFTALSKQQCADKLKSFKKLMIFLAFEAFLEKINNALKKKSQEYKLGKGKYTVNILSFPLAKHKKNIDGLLSNLIVECFEFVNYEQYLSVLTTFNEEKIPAHKLSVPRCRYIVELFFDKSYGVMLNFGNQRFWSNLKKELCGDSVYNKILAVEKDVLTINYSWGSNFYELSYLQQQFLTFPDSTFADLLKRCGNRQVTSALNNFFNFSYTSYTNFVLSELLSESSSNSTFVIFCYKDPKDLLIETSLSSVLNIPYKFLIKKKLVNLDHLKKNGCNPQISESFYYFDKGQQESLKRIFTGKIPAFEVSGLKVASETQFRGPKLDEYIELVIKPVKTIIRSSSAKLRVFSVSSSKTSTKLLHGSFQNFKNYSFIDYLPQIIRIQSAWRGYQSRKYFKALLNLHKSAEKIQKLWKGYKQRKKLNLKKVIASIRLIQKLYKIRYFRRNRAAKHIQKFFLNKFYTFSHSNHSKSSFNKSSGIALRTTQRSLIRAQNTKKLEKSFKFVPSLSKKTLELAKKTQTNSYKGLKIEDRLMLQGKEMIEKKEVAALNKKRNELRLNPSSSVKAFNNHFYEDNLQFLTDKKTALKDLKIAKVQQEMKNCTFKPNISSTKRPRSALETVNDLYNWNQRRNKQLESKRKLSEDKDSQKHEKFRVTGKSQEINKVKEKQQQAKLNLMRTIQKSIEPYWPNK